MLTSHYIINKLDFTNFVVSTFFSTNLSIPRSKNNVNYTLYISVKDMFILFYIICVLISPPQLINNHNCNRKTYSIVLIYYAINNIIYCYTSSQKISNIEEKQITVNVYSTPQIVRVCLLYHSLYISNCQNDD